MLRRALVPTFVLTLPTLGLAQAGAASGSLEGVWRIAEVTTTGANPGTNASPQPSLIIFAKGHYAWLSVGGTQPRARVEPPKDPSKPTDAEKIAWFDHWDPVTANAGTYEISGTTLTRRPTMAKNLSVMTTDPPRVQEFKLDGNTLWLTSKSAAGQPASETRYKLVRVQ